MDCAKAAKAAGLPEATAACALLLAQMFVKGGRTTVAKLWPWQSIWELKLLVQQHQGEDCLGSC